MSIDEAVISLHGCPALKVKSIKKIGRELKGVKRALLDRIGSAVLPKRWAP